VTQELANIHKSVIEECIKGNTAAQYTLYNLYSKAMFNLAFRMVNNREDAEDILQESFSDAFGKLKTFRFESTFGAWLKTIVIHRSINHLKKRKNEIITDNLPEDMNNEEVNEKDLILDAQKVFNAIEKLPDGYRIVLTLYLLEGYDHTEISEILEISESTSKTQYMRAKNRLKQLLKGEELTWTN
jgi:RNA polymerase sigma-70 factor (ECF subfamily)